MAPGLAGTASAQDASLCTDADGAESGTKFGRYTVVYGSGGSGSQIVLGYGDATLSGGSGNDVLCVWGGGNILDGGSGSDILIVVSGTGNELYGGSGKDTMIGYAEDFFDGGSGRNTIQFLPAPVMRDLWISGGLSETDGVVGGTGFTPNSTIQGYNLFFVPSGNVIADSNVQLRIDTSGSFTIDLHFFFCGPAGTTAVEITATDAEEVTYTETFELDCPRSHVWHLSPKEYIATA